MIMSTSGATLSGTAQTQSFGIEMNESMFNMLTKNVYTDTTLAVMREWSTNAGDACIDADLPVKFDVNLPTILVPKFSVRDYGTGLEDEDVRGLFAMLGASTKRDSNKFNGTFGIGRMAGLAYTDSFTVDSFKDGLKMSYLVSTDSGIPQIVSLGNTATNEDNGLQLSVNVKSKDMKSFQTKAIDLYRYFEHKPTLNMEIKYPENTITLKGNGWYIEDTDYHDHFNGPVVIMGNVAYKFPTRDITGVEASSLANTSVRLEVPLGKVSITPGRESLSMDDKTIAYLGLRLNQVHKNIEQALVDDLKDITSPWDRICHLKRAQKSLPYGVGQKVSANINTPELKNNELQLNMLPNITTSLLTGYYKTLRHEYKEVEVNDKTKLLIADTRIYHKESAIAYRSSGNYTKVIILKPLAWDKSQTAIDAHIVKCQALAKKLGIEELELASNWYSPAPKVTGVQTKATNFTPLVFNFPGWREYQVTASKGEPIEEYDDTHDIFYVEMSGYQPINETFPEIHQYMSAKYIYEQQLGGKAREFSLVGVPKGKMSMIKNDSRFKPMQGDLGGRVAEINVVDNSEHEAMDSFLNGTPTEMLKGLEGVLPAKVVTYATAVSKFHKDFGRSAGNMASYYSHIPESFVCIKQAPKLEYSFKEFKADYPLAQLILQRYTSDSLEEKIRYIKLEQAQRNNI